MTRWRAASLERSGDEAAAAGSPSRAISFYRQSDQLLPTQTVRVLDKISRLWMSMGHPFEAMEVVESIVRRSPNDPSTRADLAGLQGSLGLEYRHVST